MRKKLTITIDKEVYEGLHRMLGRRRLSRFVEDLVRPHVQYPDFEAAYEEMAQDEVREAAALEWAEATADDGEQAQAAEPRGGVERSRDA